MAKGKLDLGLDLTQLKAQLDQVREELKEYQKTMPTGYPPQSKAQWDPKWLEHEVTVEEDFDPSRVEWKELMKLYQDDPLLMAIFERLKQHFEDDGDPSWAQTFPRVSPSGTPPSPSYWTTTTPLTVSSGSASLSPTFTLTYDSSGTATLHSDTSSTTNTLVSWDSTGNDDE